MQIYNLISSVGQKSVGKMHLQWIGEVANSVMTRAPPVGAPFTGMMLGLYSYGELQKKCLTPADFHYAEVS